MRKLDDGVHVVVGNDHAVENLILGRECSQRNRSTYVQLTVEAFEKEGNLSVFVQWFSDPCKNVRFL
jgi:hypothetical protein